MTTYRNIHGRPIQAVSTDPTEEVAEGQIWYNTTSDTFKTVLVNEAWASGSPLITGVYGSMQFGTQTAGVAAGGSASPGITNVTQEYNGSGWSSESNLGTGRYRGGAGGTETAGVVFGGEVGPDTTATEEYDGSSWTSGGAMSKARRTTGFGIQTSASAVGGYDNANKLANVEDYNGTSWTSGTNLPLAGTIDSGSGLTSSARVAGGIFGPGSSHPPSSPQTFNNNIGWDGTSWSDDTAIPVNRYNNSGCGTSSDDYYTAGGRNPSPATLNTTVYWNGSAWSDAPTLATARYNGQGINGTPSAFFFAGGNPGEYTNTEEFTASANVITGAAFSSGGAANFARRQLGYTGAGTQNAFMVYGGFSPSGMVNNSEEYGGATWTATPTLNTARGQDAGFGITTAAVCCGGATPTIGGYTEEYNGSSWTTVNSMSTNRYEFGATGILTAGLALQGDQGPSTPFGVTCEEYDGTNWSSGGTASTARRTNSGVGTQTATITAGGQVPGPSATANVESYDGTSFSEVNNLNVARGGNAVMGGPAGATSSVITGGNVPTQFSISEQWNGTSMVTGASMANDRSTHGAGGTSALGIVGLGQIGPSPPYGDADTEEYVGETSALNVKTLTQS